MQTTKIQNSSGSLQTIASFYDTLREIPRAVLLRTFIPRTLTKYRLRLERSIDAVVNLAGEGGAA